MAESSPLGLQKRPVEPPTKPRGAESQRESPLHTEREPAPFRQPNLVDLNPDFSWLIDCSTTFATVIIHTLNVNSSAMASSQLLNWTPSLSSPDFKAVEVVLLQLEQHLTLRTYLDGYRLSSADTEIWTALRTSKVASGIVRKGSLTNVARWSSFIEASHPEIQAEIKATQAKQKEKRAAASKAGGNYNIGLKNTENGVVTRFPPEPS